MSFSDRGGSGWLQIDRAPLRLFVVSFLVLYLELACIRWFPAHVVFLSFFTNVVLLASFLGISLGCLAARQPRRLLAWTPGALTAAMLLAGSLESAGDWVRGVTDVGNQTDPQIVFFGAEALHHELTPPPVPMEAISGFFFLLIALAMVGPGQELGRALRSVAVPLAGYRLNLLGSIMGVACFAGMAWASLPPFVWFLPIAAILWHALRSRTGTDGDRRWNRTQRVLALLLPLVSEVHTIDFPLDLDPTFETRWSPYYRIDYAPSNRSIRVNLIGHQAIQGAAGPTIEAAAYSLPYLFQRDSGGRNFDDVLVIGAGSGNDVSRALMWGARRVDAVEIDPVILRLGNEHHPARPYSDARVTTYLDDGRNFLRKSGDRYDLIVFALVDSLVLHSGYSNIRLESYLFTREAFSDVRERLKPGGVFVVYNYFRQGWIIGKLDSLLSETFGEPPLTFSFPHQPIIDSAANQNGAFTMFVAGDAHELRAAFDRFGRYCFDAAGFPSPEARPGFLASKSGSAPPCLLPVEPSRVIADPKAALPTDDWPFLYLREPMVPALSLRGIGVMAILSVALFASFGRMVGGGSRLPAFQPRFFFLGAGFMLIETKAVVQLALLVGSTWVVNSIVILAILLMILASVSAARRWPSVGERVLYGGLFISLAANALIPLDALLEVGVGLQLVLACALLATPLFFSGVIFARSFARSSNPDAALGINLAGSMLGGFAEYGSMLLGFQALPLLAFVFYVLSIPHRDAR